MRQYKELNHYELLQVTYDASSFTIRQAYKEMVELYRKDSLATYSLFSDDERNDILARIENAFLTLIDRDKRYEYDRMLVERGELPDDAFSVKKSKAISILRASKLRAQKEKIDDPEAREMLRRTANAERISGGDLRRLREKLGIERNDVFQATKISPTVLDAIEQDDYDNLPPGLYLRSFLGSYAEVLQLDAQKIVTGYLKNMEG